MRASFLLALLLALLLAPRPARANMAKAVIEGERAGVIAPEKATAVRVDRETLDFVVGPDLAWAAVTARYWLTNAGADPEGADIAFTYVRAEDTAGGSLGAHAAVALDGAPLPFRAVTDVDLLQNRLTAWLKAHPRVDGALPAAASGDAAALAELARNVAEAGGRCDGPCPGLVAWYRDTDRNGDELEPLAEEGAIRRAVREAIPAAEDDVARGWSTIPGARLGFLFFHLDLPPGATRTLEVRYRQRASVDRAAHVNPTYRFDYLLSPAKRWAAFGPLDVSVQLPDDARFASALPFRAEGGVQRAELAGLPEGELTFEAMSTRGLWLGMTEPRGYWAILMTAMAAVTALVGAAAGRFLRGVSGWKRFVLPIVTAGPLAAVCNVAVLVLLLAAFPPAGLGFGYAGLLGGALLVLLSVPAGAIAGAVWAARGTRRPAD